MSCTRQQVLDKLGEAPRWIDSGSLAYQVGGTAYTVTSILSKLAAYGLVDRKPSPLHKRRYLYRRKEPQP
jgi:predicted transcriptional regulator